MRGNVIYIYESSSISIPFIYFVVANRRIRHRDFKFVQYLDKYMMDFRDLCTVDKIEAFNTILHQEMERKCVVLRTRDLNFQIARMATKSP